METNSGRRRRALAWALCVLALVEAVYTVAALVVGDSSLAEAVGSYSVTNVAIGGSFAAAGGVDRPAPAASPGRLDPAARRSRAT